jgi:glyoxylase-like metal-dependent hydrolase (beta-lactamase superfamily II)/rhodanese-related sulfurtransferase
MYIEQIYTKCLAEATYYIESNGYAAVIDPLRDVEPYLELAERRGARIIYIFETHFHADFVSGHVDLAGKTGAPIIYGPTTVKTGFEALIAEDGQEFKLGDVKIRLIHTPGHTLESSCFLLQDEQGKEVAIFTGDTLFIGDVGRPDLAQKLTAELTPQLLAGLMFDSLRNKIMPLPDDLIVYPGHGAGSACGKNMSKETTDTLGHQKETNYALDPALSKEEFIKQVLIGLTPPPNYFPQDVLLNIKGYESADKVIAKGCSPLSAHEFAYMAVTRKALILDSRDAQEFCKGHVPGSVNIGIDGSFAVWVGTLIEKLNQPILLVTTPGKEKETVTRLARVGYDNVLGFLAGSIQAWLKDFNTCETIRSISAEEFAGVYTSGKANVLDVRKDAEYRNGHLKGASNFPLDYINKIRPNLHKHKTYYIYCGAGYRSMTFISLLKMEGYTNLIDVRGGFAAIRKCGLFEDHIEEEKILAAG